MNMIKSNTITFGVGPAGTGKTFLAVAAAVSALKDGAVKRIVLIRPVVEAGEHLGFLPGTFQDKLDPYLRPLYDSLYQIIGPEETDRLIHNKIIETAPLAFMRGRTLADSFVLLDESQNTTKEQMQLLLTRLGPGSTFVINGDVSQIDLTQPTRCGLKEAVRLFADVEGIGIYHFTQTDVVRHPLVSKMVKIYEERDYAALERR